MGLFGVRSDIAAALDDVLVRSQGARAQLDALASSDPRTRLAAANSIRATLAPTTSSADHLLQYRDFDRVVHRFTPDVAAVTWAAGAAASDVSGTLGRDWVARAVTPYLDHLDDTVSKAKRISAFWVPTFPDPVTADATRGAALIGPLRSDELHRPSWFTGKGLAAHNHHAWFEGRRAGVDHTLTHASPEFLRSVDEVVARLSRSATTGADHAILSTHREVLLELAARRAAQDGDAGLAAFSLLADDAARPLQVRPGLVRARDVLATLRGTIPPEAEPIRAQTVELVERNLQRIERPKTNDGYANYPDYAELGAIRSNLSLLGAFMHDADRTAASAGDFITW